MTPPPGPLPQLVKFEFICVPSASCQTPYALGCRRGYCKLIYFILLMFSPFPCCWGSRIHALRVKSHTRRLSASGPMHILC